MYLVSRKQETAGLGRNIRTLWGQMSLQQRRQALPPALRVQDLSPSERIRGLTPQQLVMHLSEGERQSLRLLLEQ